MQYIVLIFGVLLLAAGAVILVKPDFIFGFLTRNKDSLGIHVFAVVVRLMLGAALIVHSQFSKFPLAFEVLGWITLIAAIALAVMGRSNFRCLMNWATGLTSTFGRIAGVFAILLGGFLIYAT